MEIDTSTFYWLAGENEGDCVAWSALRALSQWSFVETLLQVDNSAVDWYASIIFLSAVAGVVETIA